MKRIAPILVAGIFVALLPATAWASFYPKTVTNDTTPPIAPGSLVVSAPAEGKLRLTWTPATDSTPGSGIAGYIVYRSAQTFTDAAKKSSTAAVEVVATPGNVFAYEDVGLVRGDVYYYAVSAENVAGLEGPISAVASGLVTGQNAFPHSGYSQGSNLCRNCHKVHRSPAPKKILRKSDPEETCFACHDGTGSVYDIRQTSTSGAHHTVLTAAPSSGSRCTHWHNAHGATAVVGSNSFLNRKPEEGLCLTCHIDGRSKNGWAIAGQFSGFSYHSIKTGATTDGLPGAAIECSNCHGPHTAQQGSTGSSFQIRLAKPFNTYQSWGGDASPANLTSFCLQCHKPAPWPARTLVSASIFVPYDVKFPEMSQATFPFFSGWDKTAFSGSAHYGTGNSLSCRNCHSPHGSDNPRLTAFFDPPLADANTTNNYDGSSAGAREERLCFRCHQAAKQAGFASAPDVKADVEKGDTRNNPAQDIWYSMPIKDYELRHKDTEGAPGLAGTNRHAECVDCHDPHIAKTRDTNGGNGLRPANLGVSGVAVTNGSTGAAPTYASKILGAGDKEYELCLKCHSAFAYGANPPESQVYDDGTTQGKQGDKSIEFNPANSSYHPVEAAGKNISQNLANQLTGAGLSTSSTIRCSDCHNSDQLEMANGGTRSILNTLSGQASGYTGAFSLGSHGSIYQSLLRANYYNVLPGPVSWDPENFRLCFSCHRQSELMGASTNFAIGGTNLHKTHLQDRVSGGQVMCKKCHWNTHSNVAAPNTQWAIDGVVYGDQAGEAPPSNINTHLINFAPGGTVAAIDGKAKPEWQYSSSTRMRGCYLSCHGKDMRFFYRPDTGDQPAGQ